ncbi:MAG: hypothetical protein J2P37_26590 [Ktedonobacteraceae bacterium]|nr:hypothetical protein [Ktedonobacteraceae bacterium]MBO0792551.1 hypothetical protein [Ktedonobacteraceae bacterium]
MITWLTTRLCTWRGLFWLVKSGLSTSRRGRRRERFGPRLEKGVQTIHRLMEEGALRPYDPELVMEMLITITRWIINRCLDITEEQEEPLKQFCVQWLSGLAALS